MTSERTAHTPTPWRLSLSDDTTIISANNTCAVAFTAGDYTGAYGEPEEWPRMEANAAFIVAACNAYDANQADIAALKAEVGRLRGEKAYWQAEAEKEYREAALARAELDGAGS